MDWSALVIITLGIASAIALAFLPAFLPWPQRVRWTLAARTMGMAGEPLISPPPDFREVVLLSVDTAGNHLTVRVREVARPAVEALTFVDTAPPPPELVALLRDWCAVRTPMLLVIDRSGVASLDGPVATVTDLCRV